MRPTVTVQFCRTVGSTPASLNGIGGSSAAAGLGSGRLARTQATCSWCSVSDAAARPAEPVASTAQPPSGVSPLRVAFAAGPVQPAALVIAAPRSLSIWRSATWALLQAVAAPSEA